MSMTGVAVALRMERVTQFRRDAKLAAGSLEEIGAASGRMAAMTSRATMALGRVKTAGLAMKRVGGDMTRSFTLPIAIVGYEAGKLAMHFDQAMVAIQTQAGASAGEVKNLREKVLDLAKAMPQSPEEMAKGLYHLESVGLRGAAAMDALKIAAQGAMVGNADLEETATALGAAWLVNIKGAGDLHKVMGILNATVGAGNMRMGELVEALGTGVLPSAKEAGLGIRDVMGALAVFTDEGYQASSASAQFATALHFLYNPTAKAEAALNGIGLSGKRLARDMHKPQGLLVAMRDLKKHMHGMSEIDQEQLLGQILPGGRGRILLVLLNQLDRYEQKLGQIDRTSSKFGASVKRSQMTPLNRLKSAWSAVQVSLIRSATAALPAVAAVFEKIADAVEKVSNWFNHLSPGSKKLVVSLAAFLAIGGPILTLLGTMALGVQALGTALLFVAANPVVILIAALAALVLYSAVHFDRIKRGARNIAHFFSKLGKTMWSGLKTGARAVLNWIIDRLNDVIDAINSADGFTIAGHRIGAPTIGHVGHVGGGGDDGGGKRRKFRPRDFAGVRVAGPGGTHVYLDGKEVSAMVLKRSKDTARRK